MVERYPHTENHRAKGGWNHLWEQFHERDPDFLEADPGFRSVEQSQDPLAQQHKESILIAIDATTTHPCPAPPYSKSAQGRCDPGEKTIRLTRVMGIHCCNPAIPILMKKVSKLEA